MGGRDANGRVIDFPWVQNLDLNPGEIYYYTGSLPLSDAGNYHFFVAYQTEDGNWNTNVDLASGLNENDRTQDITVDEFAWRNPQKFSPYRGGVIVIPTEEFPEGKGRDIPIFVPDVIDNSNVIRQDNDWKTIKEIHKTKLNFDFWQFISGYQPEQPEESEFINVGKAAGVSFGIGLLQSLGESLSVLDLDIVIQQDQKTPENFRAIIQYGNTKFTSFMNGERVIIDNPTEYRKYISEDIAKKFNLDPDQLYAMILKFDPSHKSDEYIGYISLSPDNKIILTPKIYSGDVLKIIRYCILCIGHDDLIDLSGDSFIVFTESRLNDAGSMEVLKALYPICLNPKSGYTAQIHSPGELRVYDSQNRVTGLVNGNVKQEIQNSLYYSESKRVAIFDSTDTYHYEVVGTDIGTYGLDIISVEDGEATTFTDADIPIASGAVYQYTIDWDALSRDGSGIIRWIDSDGDGTFEQTVVIQLPTASFTYLPENPRPGQTMTFDASSSHDPDGEITSYKWDFGDGWTFEGETSTATHLYSSSDNFTVTLTVRDNDGAINTSTTTIRVSDPGYKVYLPLILKNYP